MHIPDGYLSPSTCAALYAGSAPFWYVALRRVERELNTRTIPLLSVFSAFSFVIMMFNFPLPGGTTGHAVGMGVASIMLGPWVSIMAISVALLIQALLFGDGGITAFGANCFNMAIVGSLVAFAVYRVLAFGSKLDSARRVFAAGCAGYAAINAAALCAAIEFGIQPLLFRDAAGAPLYAPYPLAISVPAMMLGHLTFAGLAELVLSAGIVRYFQRADPELLRRTAPDAPDVSSPLRAGVSTNRLWAALGLAVLLTPLGIIAVGSAWGEWRAHDFSDAAARKQITAASRNQPPPAHIPRGLERLSNLWKAPVSDYKPAFIGSHASGYLFSALIGVGLIAAIFSLARRRRSGFLEATVQELSRTLDDARAADDCASSKGFLQSLDPRVKLIGMGALVIATVAVREMWALAFLLAVSIAMAAASSISLRLMMTRVWVAVLLFTGVIATPALFLVPNGVRAASFLVLRAGVAASLCFLLVTSTLWNRLLRALRLCFVPVVVVVIIETTYRFVFLFIQTAENMFESRRTRLLGYLGAAEKRRFAVATAGVLLDKSLQLSGEVHTAMQARGFRGEPALLEDLQMNLRDGLSLAGFISIAALLIWLGR